MTLEPQLTVPPPLAEPPAAGELLVLIVQVVKAKLATRLRFALAVKT